MMRRLCWIAAAAVIVFGAAPSLAAETEGTVVVQFENLILIRTAPATDAVVLVTKNAAIRNVPAVRDLNPGDYIAVTYTREVAGVKLAEAVERDTGIALFDPAAELSTPDLYALINSGKTYRLIDIRPADRFRASHIPTAWSNPSPRVKKNVLPKDRSVPLILYGESKRDALVNEAARGAISAGYSEVKVYRGGWEHWVRAGYYTVTTMQHLKGQVQKKGATYVFADTRREAEVKRMHISGAVHARAEMMNVSDIMPGERLYPILFYGEDTDDPGAARAAIIASLSGYALRSGEPVNVLHGGFRAWRHAGMPVARGPVPRTVSLVPPPDPAVVSLSEFKELWNEKGKKHVLLDVRSREEVAGTKRKDVLHIPIEELPFRIGEVPKNRDIIAFCSAGRRSRIAYHMLKQNNYRVRFLATRPPFTEDGTIH